jgi:predicted AAA+ superfamily ATPase
LTDTRVVLVTGARQCGKSTLLGLVAKGRKAEWRNLDSAAARQAASTDPAGFVDTAELMVIDEIQRVPELLLAIKEQVDTDPRPGRYLLTGSARVLGLRALPDTQPGRVETIELWPLSQGEIDSPREKSTAPRMGLLTPSSSEARRLGTTRPSAGRSMPNGSCEAAFLRRWPVRTRAAASPASAARRA